MLSTYDASQYIVTSNGNKISRKSKISGSDFISFGGRCIIKEDVMIRGDLRGVKKNIPSVILGKYVFIMQSCLIVPPMHNDDSFRYSPMRCGSFVEIEPTCIIKACSIGNHVSIRTNTVVGNAVFIKDCCVIMKNTVIPDNSVIPPFSIVKGNPGRIIGKLNPNYALEFEEQMKTKFQYFQST